MSKKITAIDENNDEYKSLRLIMSMPTSWCWNDDLQSKSKGKVAGNRNAAAQKPRQLTDFSLVFYHFLWETEALNWTGIQLNNVLSDLLFQWI